jgi:small-conductance mechanosensitive channel
MKSIETVLDFKLIELKGFTLTVTNILILVVIIILSKILIKGIDRVIKKRLAQKAVIDEGRSTSITQIFKYIIYLLSVFIAIKSLGIDVSIIFGVFAALGLGVGFALQDVFKDLISGIIILFEGNVSPGDILEVEGLVGVVKKINLRTSSIRTRDGVYIVIPNSKVVNEKVINWSTNTKITRFNVAVGVAYGSDIEKVRNLLIEAAQKNGMIEKKPAPMVFFKAFADSSLNFELHFWIVDTWQTELVKSDLRFAIDKLFRENNISIPFPQRDVHLIQSK